MTAGKWIFLVMMLLASGGALAEGGKVRGDKGQGSVVQTQNRLAEPSSPYVAALPYVVPDERDAEPVLPEYDEMQEDEMMF